MEAVSSHDEITNNIKDICKHRGIELDDDVSIDSTLNALGISSIDSIRLISELESVYRKKVDFDHFIEDPDPSIRTMFSDYIGKSVLAKKISTFQDCNKRVIIDSDGSEYTYAELFEKSQYYSLCFGKNLNRHDVVVIDMPKSIDAVSVILACILSGNGFCILDQTSPANRKEDIVRKISPAVIISEHQYENVGVCSFSTSNIKNIERNINSIRYPGNIIFTSGSTGEPKGVKLSFDSLDSYVDSMLEILPERHARWLSVSPLHFDIYQLDFLLQLVRGMDIVIAPTNALPQQLVATINKYAIQETIFVSTILKMICSVYPSGTLTIDCLEKLYYGAESCPTSVLNEIEIIFPKASFCQFYGPSENTNNTTFFNFSKSFNTKTGFMPLGKAIKNTVLEIIDGAGKKISTPNEIGEVRLSGKQLMDGYVKEPDKERKEIPLRLPYYMTGDFAYMDSEGLIWFSGRKDDLVKLRGNRLSLQEVEIAALKSFPSLKFVLPMVIESDNYSRLVMGYVGDAIDTKELRISLKEKLPKYGVPESYLNIPEDEVKYLSTGKFDKKHLKKYIFDTYKEGVIS